MSVNVLQHSFNSGELSPSMFARTDIDKYKQGAAVLRNFFVDYRGGASTRPGTKYSLLGMNASAPIRLIPFTASFTTTFALEFGQNYIRFHSNGAPVLESTFAITGATQANPCVLTVTVNNYNVGDWIFVTGVTGMTQLNGRYFVVGAVVGAAVTIEDLLGNNINSTGYGAYVSGGTAARVYTLQSPYQGKDLAQLKFAQSVNLLILCHPNFPPYVLTFNANTSWTISQITFGPTINSPSGIGGSTTLAAGSVSFAYVVTAVDNNGQESAPSTLARFNGVQDIQTTGGTNTITWVASNGAAYYNVYRAQRSYAGAVPAGIQFGFVGFTTGLSFTDTYPIAPNFAETPPIAQNPFLGAPVASYTVTAAGTYTTPPGVTVAAPPNGLQATAYSVLGVTVAAVSAAGTGYNVGDAVPLSNGVVLIVATVGGGGTVTSFRPLTYPGVSVGSITGGSTPTNPVVDVNPARGPGTQCSVTLTWGVTQVVPIAAGTGYLVAPAVTFSSGAAAATSTLGQASAGNPTVPAFFQQRLVLAGPTGSPQTFYMSTPGAPYNFNTSVPVVGSDAITGSIVSSKLNTIKSLISMSGGLITLTTAGAWQINGGTAGAAVTPIDITAQAQAYNGASDLPPIVANYDLLYAPSKGSMIRDLTYNFYANIYTGTDISALSNHLFFGYTITEWAFAEEPFKIVWAIRNDGQLLSLTFLKEQEIVGWAHSDTKGVFESVCSVNETTGNGTVDATYFVVRRLVGGLQLRFIERLADRFFNYGLEDAWALDCAVGSVGTTPAATLSASSGSIGTGVTFTASATIFNGGMVGNVIRMGGGIATITGFTSSTVVTGTITQAITAITPNDPANTPLVAASGAWTQWVPFTTFSGLDHLNGQVVSAIADGVAVSGLTVTAGSITLPNAATKVVAGLPYTAQLQTLYLDVGEPTIQGKLKQVSALTVRARESRGLQVGRKFSTLVPIKEGSIPILVPSGLVTADERVIMDPQWDVPGQICIQQSNPYPATILGVIPEITIGSTAK